MKSNRRRRHLPLFLANRNNVRTCPAQKFRSASCHHHRPAAPRVCLSLLARCHRLRFKSISRGYSKIARAFTRCPPASRGEVVLSSFVLCSSTVITTQLIAHPQWKCHVHYYLHYWAMSVAQGAPKDVRKINYPSCRNQTIYMHTLQQCWEQRVGGGGWMDGSQQYNYN